MGKHSVLVIHNRYLQPGGEDAVVAAEIDLLRRKGHRVLQYARHNREIGGFSLLQKAGLAFTTTWNHESYSEVRRLIRQERPGIAHCHNLLPLLSPAVYYACAAEGLPVVQTVHNFRLLCPGGDLFRNGAICDACLNGLHTALVRACYRDSRLQTTAIVTMLHAHRALGTWHTKVNSYIAPSQFCRSILLRSGLSADRVAVKPHFAPQIPSIKPGFGEYAIFLGRLSAEKGILELLDVWRGLPQIPLLVVGSGPLHGQAQALVHDSGTSHITFTGQLSHDDALQQLRNARFLIAPNVCYETFGLAVLEAAACGVPAIVPRMGALPELISDRRTGVLYDAGDIDQLADVVHSAWTHPLDTKEMGRAARHACLEHYSPESNYKKLMNIYQAALDAPDHLPAAVPLEDPIPRLPRSVETCVTPHS